MTERYENLWVTKVYQWNEVNCTRVRNSLKRYKCLLTMLTRNKLAKHRRDSQTLGGVLWSFYIAYMYIVYSVRHFIRSSSSSSHRLGYDVKYPNAAEVFTLCDVILYVFILYSRSHALVSLLSVYPSPLSRYVRTNDPSRSLIAFHERTRWRTGGTFACCASRTLFRFFRLSSPSFFHS